MSMQLRGDVTATLFKRLMLAAMLARIIPAPQVVHAQTVPCVFLDPQFEEKCYDLDRSDCATLGGRPRGPIKVEVGFYLMKVYDIDIQARSFKADFYVWMYYDNDLDQCFMACDEDSGIRDVERLEAVNGQKLDLERQEYNAFEGDPNRNHVWFRVRGTFYHDFRLDNYPFDEQNLRIDLENPVWDASKLGYEPSFYCPRNKLTEGCMTEIDGTPEVYGDWDLTNACHVVSTHKYDTKWGLKSGKVPDEYSQTSLIISLRRAAWISVVRLFIPVVAAAAVASLVLFMRFDRVSSALQLCIAMLLGIVAEHHAFLTAMPAMARLVIANFLYLSAYLYVLALMWIILSFGVRLGEDTPRMIDPKSRKTLMAVIPFSYFLIIVGILLTLRFYIP